MLFPAIGTISAIWLVVTPLLGLESGFRATVSVVFGLAALVLAPLSLRSRASGHLLTGLGFVLAFVTLAAPAPIASTASLATCAVAFALAGLAPMPVPAVEAVPPHAG